MFKKTALVAGIGLALSVTAQADYQWELDAGYARGTYQRIDVNDGPDADAWSLDLEQFWAFGNGGLKARASGGKTYLSDSQDDPTTWLLGGTWYLNNNIGFGADYLQSDDDGFETQGFRVNAEWFITENFAVNLAYAHISPDDIDSPSAF
ncbi:MAG: hypothetical protein IPG06_24290 [Haliea sp.]|nr:hypothetical protein [Haliea sp.]